MTSSDPPVCLETLPIEILVGILEPLAATDLLPLAPVSHLFHCLVAKILHRRLIDVASLPHNDLIFECYHPSAKISTPYFTCQNQGLKTRGSHLGSFDDDAPALSDLKSLYSSFRPVTAFENRHTSNLSSDVPPVDDTATEDIFLDEDELFCQLCAGTILVKSGPRRGLFLSSINMGDGVLRVWREWLAKAAKKGADNDAILWIDNHQGVGIRFRVVPGAAQQMPVIAGPDDYPQISYKLYYEELLVRTKKLLLAAEKSEVQEVLHSGNAVVIASIATCRPIDTMTRIRFGQPPRTARGDPFFSIQLGEGSGQVILTHNVYSHPQSEKQQDFFLTHPFDLASPMLAYV